MEKSFENPVKGIDIAKMQRTFAKNREISETFNKKFGETFSYIHEQVIAERLKENPEKGRIKTEIDIAVDASIGDRSSFKNWKAGKVPKKSSVVKYAIATKMDLLTTITLLRSGGFQFNLAEEKEYAWAYLIMYCSGLSIEACNEVLEKLGYDRNKKKDKAVFLKVRKQRVKSGKDGTEYNNI